MEALSILGWKNEHELNYFPFTQQLISDQGIELPHGLLVDAQLVVAGNPTVKLRKITIISGTIQIELHVTDAFTELVLTSSISISEVESYGASIVDSSGISYGRFVFGRDAKNIAKKILNKIYSFERSSVFLETSCLLSLGSSHVTGVSNDDNLYRGAITLKEGDGVSITKTINGDRTTIKVNAIGSLTGECCKEDYPPLKTINLMPPNVYGNFSFSNINADEPLNKDSLRETIKITKNTSGIKLDVI